MKRLFLIACMILPGTVSFSQHQLEKMWESDTVTLKGPESVLFDSISNSLYVSSMNSGTVVRMNPDGKVISKDWITGLQSNKGSAIQNGMFYTAENKGIAVIDIGKSQLVKRIPVDSAVMLNDLAIDSKGIIYVSDTRAGKVYRIKDDKPSLYLANIPGANGLLTVNNDLYVLSATSILKVVDGKIVATVSDDFETGLDGIVMVAGNEFIISNYKGILWYVKADGVKELLLDTRSGGIMANDIGYDHTTGILYVPSFRTNCIIAYKVK